MTKAARQSLLARYGAVELKSIPQLGLEVVGIAPGKAVTGTFIVTAVGGPVNHFTISSANATVTVSPSSGSLGSAGAWVTVTVTARSTVALRTSLTVNPGKLIVTVLLSIKG